MSWPSSSSERGSRAPTIGQHRAVLQARPDPTSATDAVPIHSPTRNPFAVVDALDRDRTDVENLLHGRGMGDGGVWIGIKRLEQHAHATRCEVRRHEGPRIVESQETGLDTDASVQQQLAELDDA